jgi:asparagine synthase (glutamine-hydrolysing)
MGALWMILYNMKNPPVDIGCTKGFMDMKHRGPDDTYFNIETTQNINKYNEDQAKLHLSKRELAEYTPFTFMYGYHRLCVNDTSLDASQPFEDPIQHKILKHPDLRQRPKRKLMCNGEIYNFKSLIETENFTEKDIQSKSDVEVILPLYIKHGLQEALKKVNGEYSFILTENLNTYKLRELNVYVARDPIGSKALYMVKHKIETFYMFVSELKAVPKKFFHDDKYEICQVPPGTFWSFQNSIINKNKCEFTRFCDFDYYSDINHCTVDKADPETIAEIFKNIRELLTQSVTDRFTSSNIPVGVLLSGGFDSSIILSIVIKYLLENGHDFEKNPVHAFTMGDEQSLDVKAASRCVSYFEQRYAIDIHHHIVSIDSFEQITSEIDNVIYTLETWDPTTIRAAVSYLYLFRYIKSKTDVRVLLSGEGIDELCGYHQLFDYDDNGFQQQSIKMLQHMTTYDLLRSDKIASTCGLEVRHPFLDMSLVEYILNIHPKLKRPQKYSYQQKPIEKYIVRKAFDNEEYLNADVLWREIEDHCHCFESMSQLTEHYERKYSDSEFNTYLYANATHVGTADSNATPSTKEEMHYQKVFDKYFPNARTLLQIYWHNIWE